MRFSTCGVWTSVVVASVVISRGNPEACGQSNVPAVFVCNNGNLEGSTSAFRVNADGTLQFVNKVVTGTRTTTTEPCAGCNAYEISLTPNGRYLATGHPAGDLDGITIFQVASDATIAQVYQLPLATGVGGPLDLVWLDNEYLAVTRLDPNPDQIVVYRFVPSGPALNFVNAIPVGTSLGFLAVHPSRQYLYANDSAIRVVFAFQIGANGNLSQIDSESTGAPFPLELAVSPDGTKMYAAGGISNGGYSIVGLNIAPDGTLSLMPGSPFVSPGNSPSNVWVSDDNAYLVAGHGTDATAWVFTIDQATGALTSTGNMFDVGLQGTLGDVRTMNNLLFITDNSTAIDGIMGLYSFTVGSGGTLTQNGPIHSTNGIAPRSLATWRPPPPPCPADTDGNGYVNIDDLFAVIQHWGACPKPCPPACVGDVAPPGGNCHVNIDDLFAVIGAWGPCQ
jgi:6-phosphogluconolactonase (cycloisomerase 2 family)